MPLQKRLLMAMLALLGLAALSGVATVFMHNYEFVGRIAGTLVCAAVALGICVPLSKMLDREEARPVGSAGLGVTVVGFCFALAAIWGSMLSSRLDEELALTALSYAGVAVPGVACFALSRHVVGRISGYAGMILGAVVFACLLVAIWDPVSAPALREKFAGTAGLMAGAAFPVCASLFGRGQEAWILRSRWLGLAAGVLGMAMGFYGIWIHSTNDATWLAQAFIVGFLFAGINVLLRLPLLASQRWLVYAVIGVLCFDGLAASLFNVVTMAGQHADEMDLLPRVLAAGAIVLACGVLAIAVLMAFNKRTLVTTSAYLADIKAVSMVCPRCARKNEAPLGQSRCQGCGLILLVQVAEPRCVKCNYNLLDLRSPVCPECGEPIAGVGGAIVAAGAARSP